MALILSLSKDDGDDRPLDGQHVEQTRDRHDLVRLLRHLDLTEHQALPRGEGGDHVDRRLGTLLLVAAARGLAIDGDNPGRRTGRGRHPGDEALLERLRIQTGEKGAELVVRGRAVGERTEPAQQCELLLAEPGDVHDRLSSRQHRQQAEQQHLVERVDHLAALARVRQTLEMRQKDNRFAECP